MDPQILSGKKYSHEVDLWALAISMFEIICGGRLPFKYHPDVKIMFKNEVSFDQKVKDFYSKGLIDIITRMLAIDPK